MVRSVYPIEINLLAKDICQLSLFSKTFATCKSIIKFFKNKHLPKQVLKKVQIDQFGKESALSTPVETRWSSVYKSMESVLRNKECLQAAVFERTMSTVAELRDLKGPLLDDKFWNKLKNCCEILAPLEKAIKLLEGDNYLTIAYVYPSFINIRKEIEDKKEFLPEADIKKIVSNLNEREAFAIKDVHLSSYLLHPKLKGEKLDDTNFFRAAKNIIKIGESMRYDEATILQELTDYNSRSGFWQNDFIWKAAENCQAISWWKGMCRNKVLSNIAVRLLSFPASSASCERNWKTFSLIKTKKRNRLTIERTEKLVAIKYNLSLLKPDEFKRNKKETNILSTLEEQEQENTVPDEENEEILSLRDTDTSSDSEIDVEYANTSSSDNESIHPDEESERVEVNIEDEVDNEVVVEENTSYDDLLPITATEKPENVTPKSQKVVYVDKFVLLKNVHLKK